MRVPGVALHTHRRLGRRLQMGAARFQDRLLLKRLSALALAAGCLSSGFAAPASWVDSRTWTAEGPQESQTIQGTFLDIDRNNLHIAVEGKLAPISVPIARLSPENREALTTLWKESLAPFWILDPPTGLPSEGISVNPQVRVVREDRDRRLYIYETEHFRYEADDRLSTSLVHDFSRAFEITYELFIRLPLGLRPSPPPEGGRYRIRLFRDRKDYITIGKAPPDTAGIYSFDDRTNKVPFDSLGLVRDGDRWRMDPEHYETHTLIHETTHQLMHDWGEIIPLWVAEGLAESVACIPYRTGNLLVGDWNKGVSEYLDNTIFHAVLAAAVDISQEIAVSPSPEQHPLFARIEQVLTMAESPPPSASELCRTLGVTLADPAALVTLSHEQFMSRGAPIPPIARTTRHFAPDRQIPVSFHYLTSLVTAHHFLAREGPAGPRRLRAYLMRMLLIHQETKPWMEAAQRARETRGRPASPLIGANPGAPAFLQEFLKIDFEREHPYSTLALPALFLEKNPAAFRSRVSAAAGLPLRDSAAE